MNCEPAFQTSKPMLCPGSSEPYKPGEAVVVQPRQLARERAVQIAVGLLTGLEQP
jgi:hypothetical protein